MLKKIIITAIVIIVILLVSLGLKRYRIDLAQEYIDDRLNLKHGESITQEFTAQYNNLSTIKLLETNNPIYDSKPANTENFNFKVLDKNTGQIVREVGFSGANVGVLEKLQLRFEPIVDSGGKEYLMVIDSVSSPSATVPEIALGFTRKEKFQNEKTLKSSAEPWIKGNLAFRTYYKDQLIILFKDSLFGFLNNLQKDRTFFIAYTLLLLVLLGSLLFLLRKRK